MQKIKYSILALIVLFGIGIYLVYQQIYTKELIHTDKISFEIQPGESATTLANNLQTQKIISSPKFFKLYLKFTGADKNIQSGFFEVTPPFTVAHIAEILKNAQSIERTITIIPGWDLNDLAEYFEKEGIIDNKESFFDKYVGIPAHSYSLRRQLPTFLLSLGDEAWIEQTEKETSSTIARNHFNILTDKPWFVSLEGYLAPETYRIYKNENIESVLKRLLSQREKEFTPNMLSEINRQGKSVHEILTLASIVEKEVKSDTDKAKVADLFWRRIKLGMGLQADSTVHYLSGREGDVFTKEKERQIDSLYNTYKYRDLPPGPISSPSLSSIMAVIYPEKNDAYYFLTTSSGEVKYARTFAEHNANVQKFLR